MATQFIDRFQKAGDDYDPEQSVNFRDLVLRPGGKLPADALVYNFVGEPPGLEPLHRWYTTWARSAEARRWTAGMAESRGSMAESRAPPQGGQGHDPSRPHGARAWARLHGLSPKAQPESSAQRR